jgi:hypothetical protein
MEPQLRHPYDGFREAFGEGRIGMLAIEHENEDKKCGLDGRFRTGEPFPRTDGKLLDRHWFAEQVALEGVAAVSVKVLALRLGLHAFGDDVQAERLPHGNDRLYDGGVIWIGDEVADE